jgi:hypothetical protein
MDIVIHDLILIPPYPESISRLTRNKTLARQASGEGTWLILCSFVRKFCKWYEDIVEEVGANCDNISFKAESRGTISRAYY